MGHYKMWSKKFSNTTGSRFCPYEATTYVENRNIRNPFAVSYDHMSPAAKLRAHERSALRNRLKHLKVTLPKIEF
jgi:hypothetical protein